MTNASPREIRKSDARRSTGQPLIPNLIVVRFVVLGVLGIEFRIGHQRSLLRFGGPGRDGMRGVDPQ